MHIIVLGAAAGGGLPQWNCGCQNCQDARNGTIPAMTQSCLAVSTNSVEWVLLNASPDLRTQLCSQSYLHPRGLRDSPISAVILTNGDIDHIAGLLHLRENSPFDVYATRSSLDILDSNSVFKVLNSTCVVHKEIVLDRSFQPIPDLRIVPFSVPGKVALFLETETLNLEEIGEQTIGLLIESNGQRVAFIPGCATIPDWLIDRIQDVDLLLFDGTVWNDDDMHRVGTGRKTGGRMGHIAQNGPAGSLQRFAHVRSRRVFIHINNTNPILQKNSLERSKVIESGWEVAFDGMEIHL
ncbi:MAG: pyrroloquinoline quinone biosynthesis protein PqqB [Aestuariivita sp.]|nr:pyrroloquinoline quinone biosynthesis protein PqqB [Aestuariivita sp.]